MAIDEVLCRAIETDHKFRNPCCWSWMMLQGKNNTRTRIITTYCPTVSAITGGSYSQQLEDLTNMKVKNYPRTQLWIDLNTDILK